MNEYEVKILVGGRWEDHPESPYRARNRDDVIRAFHGSTGQAQCGTVRVRRVP